MALFRRRRSLLWLSICGMCAFTVLMLSMGSMNIEEEQRWQVRENNDYLVEDLAKHRDARVEMPKIIPEPNLKEHQKENQVHKMRSTAPILHIKQSHVVEQPVPISSEIVPCSPLNSECQHFRQLVFDDWPEGKPRAAIYFLTQSKRLNRLQRAFRSLDTFFNDEFQYPIIIFHEAELVRYIPVIRNYSKSQMFFQQIEFKAPDFLGEIPKEIPCRSHIGYRHMCRFHSKGVFQQPIMRGLDYYWRLDDDSVILRNISYDIFQYMRDNQLLYGYEWRHLDSYKCVVGLWNATYKYVADNRINAQFLSKWKEPYIYYNNFEVTETKLWLSNEYANYIEYLDRLGGIFFHRWGDAPIKGLAVAVFIPKEKTHLFKDIGYQHVGFTNP